MPIQVFTSLVGDGSRGAFFAVIPRKRGVHVVLPEEEGSVALIPKHKKGDKRGIHKALAFLEDAFSRGKLQPGDLLVTDNEGLWTSDEVATVLEGKHVSHLTYPTYLGARLDPCDNSFHSVFRRQYQARALHYKRLNLEQRLRLLCTVYHEIPDEVVEGSVRHCGYAGGDPRDIMEALMGEGAKPRGGLTPQQREDVRAYLTYKQQTGYCEDDEPANESTREDGEPSEEGETDGDGEEDE